MVLYFFYKNLVFTMPQFMFAYISGYSGQTVYDDYYITSYNMILTALPLLMKAVLEQDINPETDGQFFTTLLPKLYYVGQKSMIFTWSNYLIEMFIGTCHSLLVFFIPLYVFRETIINKNGTNADMWIFSITSFSAIIFVSASPYNPCRS